MTFGRRRRRFRLRWPELAGIVFLFVTVAAGLRWYAFQSREGDLKRTTGQVVEVSGSDAEAPRLVFTYIVNGITYTSATEPDLAGRALASLLPANIMAKLVSHGIFDFDDLPADVIRQIREGTHHTFDELQADDRRALEAHGYRNAEQLRTAMLAAMQSSNSGGRAEVTSGLALNFPVSVLYDPDDPSYCILAGPDGHIHTQSRKGLTPFLSLAALTACYFAAPYPWLKRRSP